MPPQQRRLSAGRGRGQPRGDRAVRAGGGRGAAGAGLGTAGTRGHSGALGMAQYARGSAVAVIRLCNPPVNALRYHRQPAGSAGLGPPCERVGDSPSSFLFTSFRLSEPE